MDRKNFAELSRIEDKYIVTKAQGKSVLSEVAKHWSVAYPDKNTNWVMIETTYFDSPTGTFYNDHLNDEPHRIKVRLRCYSPDGKPDGRYFLEIKSKDDGVASKKRIELDDANRRKFMASHPLVVTPELVAKNKKLLSEDEVRSHAQRLNSLQSEHDLEPVLTLHYKRKAYQHGEMRVTVDESIGFDGMLHNADRKRFMADMDEKEAFSFGVKYDPDTDMVLEVKHAGSIPPWLSKLISDQNLKPTNFSKYVWSMFGVLTKSAEQSSAMFVINSLRKK